MTFAARVFFICIISCQLISCSKDQASPPMLETPMGCRDTFFTFQLHILPILNLNCNFDECHGPGGEGSYDFTGYTMVANRIRAGTFEYRLDLPSDDPQHMPEDMRLNKCDYFTLKKWIIQGFPEN